MNVDLAVHCAMAPPRPGLAGPQITDGDDCSPEFFSLLAEKYRESTDQETIFKLKRGANKPVISLTVGEIPLLFEGEADVGDGGASLTIPFPESILPVEKTAEPLAGDNGDEKETAENVGIVIHAPQEIGTLTFVGEEAVRNLVNDNTGDLMVSQILSDERETRSITCSFKGTGPDISAEEVGAVSPDETVGNKALWSSEGNDRYQRNDFKINAFPVDLPLKEGSSTHEQGGNRAEVLIGSRFYREQERGIPGQFFTGCPDLPATFDPSGDGEPDRVTFSETKIKLNGGVMEQEKSIFSKFAPETKVYGQVSTIPSVERETTFPGKVETSLHRVEMAETYRYFEEQTGTIFSWFGEQGMEGQRLPEGRNLLDQLQARLIYLQERGEFPAEIRLKIDPPQLGEMLIRVISRQGRMSAEIVAETARVKEVLSSNLGELQQRLSEMNLYLDRIDLLSAGELPFGNGQFSEHNFKQQGSNGQKEETASKVETLQSLERVAVGEHCGIINYWA